MNIEFDATTHTYRHNGRVLPSVTQVLRAVIPQFQADKWYLDKGTAMHACAAFIAKGKRFNLTPETEALIGGRVHACRKWFADFKPEVLAVEEMVADENLLSVGTPDLECVLDLPKYGVCRVVVDWKSTITPVCQWQLGGYAKASKHKPKFGMPVELREDGTYRVGVGKDGKLYNMDVAGREWAVFRSAYGMMEREKLLEKGEAA